MSTSENKAVVSRFVNEIFNAGDLDAVDRLVSADFVPHSWGNTGPGPEELKKAIRRVFAGLSENRMTIEDAIAEGDRVVVRLTSHAVHSGDFMGMPGSGKAYTIGEIHIFRVRDGKVVEHWREADLLGMLQQLGAISTPAARD
jgi:steroid delta-isomerase-like uncharacterized protein